MLGILNRIKRQYRNQFYSIFNTPVLLFRMPKVGGISLQKSLKGHGYKPLFGFHNIKHLNNRLNKQDKDFVKKLLFKSNRKIKIISPVRDPVARSISAFFHFFPLNYSGSIIDYKLENLQALFYQERVEPILNRGYFDNWFDNTFYPVTNVDVFQENFNQNSGNAMIQKGKFEILLYQSELSDENKERYLKSFLDLKDFKLKRENTGYTSDSKYSELYKYFLANFKPPEDYLTIIYQSKFVSHFYNSSQIDAFWEKWK